MARIVTVSLARCKGGPNARIGAFGPSALRHLARHPLARGEEGGWALSQGARCLRAGIGADRRAAVWTPGSEPRADPRHRSRRALPSASVLRSACAASGSVWGGAFRRQAMADSTRHSPDAGSSQCGRAKRRPSHGASSHQASRGSALRVCMAFADIARRRIGLFRRKIRQIAAMRRLPSGRPLSLAFYGRVLFRRCLGCARRTEGNRVGIAGAFGGNPAILAVKTPFGMCEAAQRARWRHAGPLRDNSMGVFGEGRMRMGYNATPSCLSFSTPSTPSSGVQR